MLSFFCILSIYLPTYSTILLMFLSKMIPLFHYFFAWWGWRMMDKKKSRKWANCHCHRTYVFAEYLFLNNIINTKTYTPSSLICFLLSPFHIFSCSNFALLFVGCEKMENDKIKSEFSQSNEKSMLLFCYSYVLWCMLSHKDSQKTCVCNILQKLPQKIFNKQGHIVLCFVNKT